MRLRRTAREFYKLELDTTPSIGATQWEASFDGGATFVPAIDEDGLSAWLVEGPDRTLGGTSDAEVITADVQPILNVIDSPEVIVRLGPWIFLEPD